MGGCFSKKSDNDPPPRPLMVDRGTDPMPLPKVEDRGIDPITPERVRAESGERFGREYLKRRGGVRSFEERWAKSDEEYKRKLQDERIATAVERPLKQKEHKQGDVWTLETFMNHLKKNEPEFYKEYYDATFVRTPTPPYFTMVTPPKSKTPTPPKTKTPTPPLKPKIPTPPDFSLKALPFGQPVPTPKTKVPGTPGGMSDEWYESILKYQVRFRKEKAEYDKNKPTPAELAKKFRFHSSSSS
ncbi:MAG: hypothetical protein M1818_005633 [Claussenomyces sp. TS43310]|nr:MAG: hypothetical protein M1818_005633 [Claussenomyces sp. TS43310]